MKKLLALVMTVVLCLCYLASCNMPLYVVSDILRNQAGCEWLNEITAEDIAEIKITRGGGGPLPPVSKTHISSSRDKAVISSVFEDYYLLEVRSVPEERTRIDDGGYVVVEFILNDETVKRLSFINGDFYHDGNGNYFELMHLPVFQDGTNFVNRYGFEARDKCCQAYLIDETFICEIPVSQFEFTELADDIYLGDTAPDRYIEMNGERLYFIKDSYFYIGDNKSIYYDLVGKNLDQLIAEYSAEECNHQWDGGVEIEGGSGGYIMEYTCVLCGSKNRETITIIPPQ